MRFFRSRSGAVLVTMFVALEARAQVPALASPRIAVAQIGELTVGKTLGEVGPEAVIRAAGQGARDACVDPAARRFRHPSSCVRPAGNAPAGVCMDVTLDQALAPMTSCEPADPGVSVVELASSACRTTECLKSDAKGAGATHVLVVQGKSSEFGLDVAVDLIDLETGAVSSKRYRDYFPAADRDDAAIVPRTGPQILAIVHGMARDLVQVALGPRLLAPPPLPPSGGASLAPPRPPLSPRPAEERLEAWALVGGGVAVGVAGGILWSIDGESKGCSNLASGDRCPNMWDTKKIGIPLVVGGALAAGAGLWLLLMPSHDHEMAFAPTGNGMMVYGRF